MKPRLTIGLITFNGSASIARSIESQLSQTFRDFTLLIFDNASTDGTSEICAAFAAEDPRVVHVRHPATVPQSDNFRGVLMAADTEYFMWATDDDLRSPRFAEDCIELLDHHPNAVAACTPVQFRAQDGSLTDARGTFSIEGTPEQRLRTYFANPRDSSRLFGVYRTDGLKKAYAEDTSVFGYDWLVVGLTMLEGDHLETGTVGLVRAANAPGKYFASFKRHFVREPGPWGVLSSFLPLLPMTRQLRSRLPRSAWRASRWRLLRLNLHQSLLMLRWRFPRLEPVFRLVRRVDRSVGNS
ncbi:MULTISPECIES: glycosyltransferase family 2 protein [Aeromicrobium]|uniref:Glycosyl transferase n=1 Tax=Aeromicrobium erythreum TaxID=2041 RepID=A0A0U4BEG7_9ACTN|nr:MULTISPECIES: glycosyltransferase family 2 protein [Aeromicrobium]ALX06036.1 glycosyl transferase [Aeromicrobium erythreum]